MSDTLDNTKGAEVIPVDVCSACGKWRVVKGETRELYEGSYGAKMAFCFACAYWQSRQKGPKNVLQFSPDLNNDPPPRGAA